jgi:K+-transporting ATPase KdpF subunit
MESAPTLYRSKFTNEMKTIQIIILATPLSAETSLPDNLISYLAGIFIAFLLLAYLTYSLIKPEKF